MTKKMSLAKSLDLQIAFQLLHTCTWCKMKITFSIKQKIFLLTILFIVSAVFCFCFIFFYVCLRILTMFDKCMYLVPEDWWTVKFKHFIRKIWGVLSFPSPVIETLKIILQKPEIYKCHWIFFFFIRVWT